MPTLTPQKVSGLVVIPTVEHVGDVHRVSLAINVGMSRSGSPPAEIVSREDLVVVLKNASEGSLEAIQSPDPGPLPTRALRVIQARGEFSYGQGVNPPDELVVNLRGDQKTFPMSQTFPQTAGLAKEPQVGDRFPATGKGRPPLLLLRRRRCCSKRFEAPLNTSTDPAAKSEFFDIEADFSARPKACKCTCCEYREFVRGTFTNADGGAVRFDLPSGALDPSAYREDGAIDEFGTGSHGYYGHRNTSSPGDTYSGSGPQAGCTYRGDEKPACPSTDTMHAEFVGLVVDVCQRKVVAKKTWVVDL